MERTLMWASTPDVADDEIIPITGVPDTITTDGASDPINISSISTLMASVKVGAPTGTTPTLDIYVDVLDALGDWLQVLALVRLTAAAYTYAAVGPATPTTYVLTNKARFRWVRSAGSSWPTFDVALAGH